MDYTKTALKGITWIGAFRIITRALSFLRTAITARILNPSQFGVFTIATLVLALIEVFTETGINIFLTHRKDDIDDYIPTAYFVSILRGILITGVIAGFAPFIAWFFDSPESLVPLLWISLVAFVRGFINPSVAKFLKDLSFHSEFYYRTTQFFFETCASLAFVLIFQSPLSLVWGLLAGAVFEVILSFYMARPWPSLAFDIRKFSNVVHHGKWVTLAGIFDFLYHNIDNIVVGRILGTGALGLYDGAYKISTLPITEVSNVVQKVAFPVFVKLGDDKKKLEQTYIKSLIFVAVCALPLGSICFFFPKEVISIVLGDKWLPAAPALQILAIFGVFRSIGNSASALFYAKQKQRMVTVVMFIGFLTLLVIIVPLVISFGIVGAAYGALLGAIIPLPFIVYHTKRLFRHSS